MSKDAAIELFREYRNEVRHQEIQRAAISGAFVTIGGVITKRAFEGNGSVLYAMALFNFSFIGLLVLAKLYERFCRAREKACMCLRLIMLEAGHGESKKSFCALDLDHAAIKVNDKTFPHTRNMQLHHLWNIFLIDGMVAGLFGIFSAGKLRNEKDLVSGHSCAATLVALAFAGAQWFILSKLNRRSEKTKEKAKRNSEDEWAKLLKKYE